MPCVKWFLVSLPSRSVSALRTSRTATLGHALNQPKFQAARNRTITPSKPKVTRAFFMIVAEPSPGGGSAGVLMPSVRTKATGLLRRANEHTYHSQDRGYEDTPRPPQIKCIPQNECNRQNHG